MTKKVLALVTHPDDAEFLCAGTLALLGEAGWELHISTMTAGDCGSKTLSQQEISAIRRQEAKNAASLIHANYQCLEFQDIFITYDKPSILKVVAHIRQVRPSMVLTMSPDCYMVDHEITSALVRTGCFTAGMTNIKTPGIEPFDSVPHLYYLDPIEGKDKLGKPIKPTTVIDISSVIDIKSDMLACHISQREWLKQHHGMDEYLIAMKRQSQETGRKVHKPYAEGFRQHLGHAYPQDNLLQAALPQVAVIF
jgi:LmbE family N-acetylglucosaminyl deacetylase